MYRAIVITGAMLLSALGFAQQTQTTQSPNPNAYTYNQPYNPPVEVRNGNGGWGLLGLLGLTGLLGLRRRETIVRSRDTHFDEKGRKVA
jgi:MYXO-CTERM domain-containing protein